MVFYKLFVALCYDYVERHLKVIMSLNISGNIPLLCLYIKSQRVLVYLIDVQHLLFFK